MKSNELKHFHKFTLVLVIFALVTEKLGSSEMKGLIAIECLDNEPSKETLEALSKYCPSVATEQYI